MAKPTTSYTPVTKNTSSYSRIAKSTTSFSAILKPVTSFVNRLKPTTGYNFNITTKGAWFLNSTFLRLDNSVYLLAGYTEIPSQLNAKPRTNYGAL